MQKLINYFSARFAQSMSDHYEKEIKKLTAITHEIEEEEEELGFTLEPEEVEESTVAEMTTTEEPTTTMKPRRKSKKRKNKKKKSKRFRPTTTTTTTSTTTESPMEMEIDYYTTEAPWPETEEPMTEGEENNEYATVEPADEDSEGYTTRSTDTETMEIADVDEHEPVHLARYPYVASRKGCILMDPKNDNSSDGKEGLLPTQ